MSVTFLRFGARVVLAARVVVAIATASLEPVVAAAAASAEEAAASPSAEPVPLLRGPAWEELSRVAWVSRVDKQAPPWERASDRVLLQLGADTLSYLWPEPGFPALQAPKDLRSVVIALRASQELERRGKGSLALAEQVVGLCAAAKVGLLSGPLGGGAAERWQRECAAEPPGLEKSECEVNENVPALAAALDSVGTAVGEAVLARVPKRAATLRWLAMLDAAGGRGAAAAKRMERVWERDPSDPTDTLWLTFARVLSGAAEPTQPLQGGAGMVAEWDWRRAALLHWVERAAVATPFTAAEPPKTPDLGAQLALGLWPLSADVLRPGSAVSGEALELWAEHALPYPLEAAQISAPKAADERLALAVVEIRRAVGEAAGLPAEARAEAAQSLATALARRVGSDTARAGALGGERAELILRGLIEAQAIEAGYVSEGLSLESAARALLAAPGATPAEAQAAVVWMWLASQREVSARAWLEHALELNAELAPAFARAAAPLALAWAVERAKTEELEPLRALLEMSGAPDATGLSCAERGALRLVAFAHELLVTWATGDALAHNARLAAAAAAEAQALASCPSPRAAPLRAAILTAVSHFAMEDPSGAELAKLAARAARAASPHAPEAAYGAALVELVEDRPAVARALLERVVRGSRSPRAQLMGHLALARLSRLENDFLGMLQHLTTSEALWPRVSPELAATVWRPVVVEAYADVSLVFGADGGISLQATALPLLYLLQPIRGLDLEGVRDLLGQLRAVQEAPTPNDATE